MMLNLKAVLADIGASQADLARALGVSRSVIAHLCNNGLWPKSHDEAAFGLQIKEFLEDRGATAATVRTALDAATAAKTTEQQPSPMEDEAMLLRKQSLTQKTRIDFGFTRNPFDDVRTADEVFLTRDSRHVREAMRQTARHGGFIAVVGESGAGKSTLREDLLAWIGHNNHPVVVIEPSSMLGMEENDIKGKTLKTAALGEAIMREVAPGTKINRSAESRLNQVKNTLLESYRAGNRHVLIIEEAHSLPIPTLKHLKRFFELKDGFAPLLGIILIGQPELKAKLDEKNPQVREVVQRCELIELRPLDNDLEAYLTHRFAIAGKALAEVMDIDAVQALRVKLTGNGWSVLYPLAVHNVVTAALNEAAEIGMPTITAELIAEV